MERADEHTGGEAAREARFFAALRQWEGFATATRVFGESLARPLGEPKHRVLARLYTLLLDDLLQGLGLRAGGGAAAEWQPLYDLYEEVNPQYVSARRVTQALERWPGLGAGQHETLAQAVSGFFALVREGFLEAYPAPRVTHEEVLRWAALFPERWAWRSTGVLRRAGLLAMASPAGYRVYVRYHDGRFEPAYKAGELTRWLAACERAAAAGRYGPEEALSAYGAAFTAACYAGRLAPMGLEAVCGDVPDCERCLLRDDCRWYNGPATEGPAAGEVLALARRGALASLGSDRLLQGLFGLDEAERSALQGVLAGSGLRELAQRPPAELRERLAGTGLAPERFQLLVELARRFAEERLMVGAEFRTAWDLFRHFRMRLRELRQEVFIVVLLDNKRRYLGDYEVTRGTLNTSPVHPREVFAPAVREAAAAILIVHNHPSGDPSPSREDVRVTRSLREAGRTMGIPVLDHVIIADDRYVSLVEEGHLETTP